MSAWGKAMATALRAWAGGPARRISIVERCQLNSACTLFLLRIDDEEILLSCTAHAVSVVRAQKIGAAENVK